MARLFNGFRTVEGSGFVIHVRFGGRSFDLQMSKLDLGAKTDDSDVKRAIAQHLNVAAERLNDYVVDRHANGNLTLRPEAMFG